MGVGTDYLEIVRGAWGQCEISQDFQELFGVQESLGFPRTIPTDNSHGQFPRTIIPWESVGEFNVCDRMYIVYYLIWSEILIRTAHDLGMCSNQILQIFTDSLRTVLVKNFDPVGSVCPN